MALHGILAALIERERSGLGQHVDANLVQGFAALDTWNWFVQLVNQRWPDAYPGAEPFDENGIPQSPLLFMLTIALTSDGRWLQFAQVGPNLFLAPAGARPQWMLTDPEWKGLPLFEDSAPARALDHDARAARSKSLAEWEAVFDADPDVYAELFRSGPGADHPQLVHDSEVVTVVDRCSGRFASRADRADVGHARAGRLRRFGSCAADTVGWTSRAARRAAVGDATPAVSSGLPLAGVTIIEMAVMYAAPCGTPDRSRRA
jgi:crotonobetainyl-CoA:carnitine CoA-transferase CaiB-like acyl-CoA transferase